MPSFTLTPVGGDPFAGGATDLDPTTAPPLTIHAQAPQPAPMADEFGRPVGDEASNAAVESYHPTLDALGAVGASLASGHAAQDYQHFIDPTGANRNAISGFSVPAMIAGAADAVTNYGRFANDVQSGRYGDQPLLNPDAVARGAPAAFDVAGLLGAGGMTQAEEGAAGIFGGRLSKTADRGAADRAESMLAQGAAPDDVWKATGWSRGADEHMRYEIPDSDATFKPGAVDAYTAGPKLLPDVLDHPDLFAAYPGLRNMVVTGQAPAGADPTKIVGAFYSNKYRPPSQLPVTYMAPEEDQAEALKTLLHETQHAVQSIEGFAPGASTSGFRGTLPAIAAIRDTKLMSALLGSGVSPTDAPGIFAQRMGRDPHRAALSLAQTFTPEEIEKLPLGPNDAYMRSMGEVEARNVEARSTMTPSQLAETPPSATQSVSNAMQLRGTGGVSQEYDNPSVMAQHQQIRQEVDDALRSGWKPEFVPEGYMKSLPLELEKYPSSTHIIRDRLLQHGISAPGLPNFSLYGDAPLLYSRGVPGLPQLAQPGIPIPQAAQGAAQAPQVDPALLGRLLREGRAT